MNLLIVVKNFLEKGNKTRVKWLLVFSVCFLFLLLVFLYSRGYVILGGEGDYFTDFELVRKYGSFAWAPLMNGTGSPNPVLNMLIPAFDVLAFLQNAGVSFKILNVLSVSFFYIFPFLSMFWMAKGALKLQFSVSFLVSLFYVINPFSTYHLNGLMFWNSAPLFILPLSFGILYKYYPNKPKAFLFFGLITSLLAFSFQNPPYLAIFHLFLLISAVIISFLWEKTFRFKEIMKQFLVSELSFFLFNFWWLANSLSFFWEEASRLNLKGVSLSWSKTYMINEGGVINNILSFRTLIGPGDYSFLSFFYYHAAVLIILSLPLALLVFLMFRSKNKKQKAAMIVFSFLLLVIFLNKGAFPPFGNSYQFCIKYIPLFELFKTPLEKFSVLFVFIFSLNLALVLDRAKNKLFIGAMIIYILVLAIPYFTLKFIPDFVAGENVYISRKFINKKGYIDSEHLLNNHLTNYRYLSLPGSKNYQVTLANHENKYYRGMDPVLYAINKGFIGAYSGDFGMIYNNLSQDNLENILSIYNIKKILINKDIYPSFGFEEKENVSKLEEIFSQKMEKVENGPIVIYSINKFLPLIYSPKHIIVSKRDPEDILRVLTYNDYDIRSGIFFSEQNDSKVLERMADEIGTDNFAPPSIEYKKINPVKYRVILHKVGGIFPLVFSEAHNEGWKLYPVKSETESTAVKNLNDYKIIRDNEEDQATKEELVSYIKSKLISTLGNGEEKKIKYNDHDEKYTINFVSKNFYGTIQNDNLSNGKFWETWFSNPINNDKNHLMANGYANSWIIDPNDFCRNNLCSPNPDGTFEIELVLEYWPERIFFGGISVTIATILISFVLMMYNWKNKKYGKNN